MEDRKNPKAFISYSRTDADHIKWVSELAEELVENGVKVVFDEWHLQEGQDLYAFMEQAVTDSEMDKVIIVTDREYAEKADEREGGVGTETQIISQDLYDQVDPEDPQRKFVAVVTEKDENGKAHLPTYMGSRLYIDMSTSDLRMDNFEQLLRWLYDQPISKEPEQGEPPKYLFQDEGPDLGTGSRARQAKRKLREGDSAALGALREYFETFADNLERFEVESDGHRLPPQQIVESIEKFLPFRNEAVDLFITLVKYWPGEEGGEVIHDFFERLLPYTLGDPSRSHGTTPDNFAFMAQELFLFAVAAMLKNERFEGARLLMSRGYYIERSQPGLKSGLRPFTSFRPYLESLEDHLDHNRINKTSDLIAERSGRQDLTLVDLMQADLVLYLRAEMETLRHGKRYRWYPDTLLRARRRNQPFELFARGAKGSTGGLETVLQLSGWDDFVAFIEEIKEKRGFPKFDGWPLDVPRLVGIKQ